MESRGPYIIQVVHLSDRRTRQRARIHLARRLAHQIIWLENTHFASTAIARGPPHKKIGIACDAYVHEAPLNTACHCTGAQRAHSASYPRRIGVTEPGASRCLTHRSRGASRRESAARRVNPACATTRAPRPARPRTPRFGSALTSHRTIHARTSRRRVAPPQVGRTRASRPSSRARVPLVTAALEAGPSHCRRARNSGPATPGSPKAGYPNNARKRTGIVANYRETVIERRHGRRSGQERNLRG